MMSLPTSPGGSLIFHVFGALAEFKRELIRERPQAGLATARTRGRKGGRPSVMSQDKLRVAREMYGSPEHTVAAIAAAVGVSRATLYRALAPTAVPERVAATPDPAAAELSSAALVARDAATVKPPASAPERSAPAATPPTSNAAQAAALRQQRAVDRVVLPSDTEALQLLCPNCAAKPGVMCRDTRSQARRKPAAAAIHMARYWRQRRCPACGATPGEPCRTPNGGEAAEVHTSRRRPTQLESEKRQQRP